MNTTAMGFLSISILVGSGILWFRRVGSVSIPENRSGYVASWLAAAALGIAALAGGVGWLGGIPAGMAAFGGLFFSVLVAVSPQRVAADAITVGASLPSFTANDEDGQPFDSSSLRGQPVLIKFFRGHW